MISTASRTSLNGRPTEVRVRRRTEEDRGLA